MATSVSVKKLCLTAPGGIPGQDYVPFGMMVYGTHDGGSTVTTQFRVEQYLQGYHFFSVDKVYGQAYSSNLANYAVFFDIYQPGAYGLHLLNHTLEVGAGGFLATEYDGGPHTWFPTSELFEIAEVVPAAGLGANAVGCSTSVFGRLWPGPVRNPEEVSLERIRWPLKTYR